MTWEATELTASRLALLIAELFYAKNLESTSGGASLIGQGPVALYKSLRRQASLRRSSFTLFDVETIARALQNNSLHPGRIDLGRLTAEWIALGRPAHLENFLLQTLGRRFLTRQPRPVVPLPIAIDGFGRIARALVRILARYGPGGELRLAMVRSRNPESLPLRQQLLQNDTVYGSFFGDLEPVTSGLRINGLDVIFADTDAELPAGCVLLDTTARQNAEVARESIERFQLRACILSSFHAQLPLIIHGLNEYEVHELESPALGAGSDAANAVLPVLKLIDQEYRIESGHVELIRPFTNDQNLLDNLHQTPRLGRAATANLVLSEENIGLELQRAALPTSITSSILRVPILNGSLAILVLQLGVEVTRDDLIRFLIDQSLNGNLRDQLDFMLAPDFVSSDATGNPASAIIDGIRIETQGRQVRLYLWYDNEMGYAMQLIRLLKCLASLSFLQYS
ncbi:MAG: hypothetical protein HS115_16430 [Spirochaetales bacterium]|nr:hypothetical protein [Spirochaetales bacterium]